MPNNIKMRTVSSLEKILPTQIPPVTETENSVFLNERFNFQAAFFSEELIKNCTLKVKGVLAPFVQVRLVGYVPTLLTCFDGLDDYVISKEPGLYPDVLYSTSTAHLRFNQWTVFWLTVDGLDGIAPGRYEIQAELSDENGEVLANAVYTLNVLSARLAENNLYNTNWIHYDCICQKHNVSPFSKEFYDVTAAYIKNAVKHGMTMLLTPIFTPPLDTKIGSERMTVQLVKVNMQGGGYSFDFFELDKFINLALECGIKYFEFSHICTQWGAKHCPKILAHESGEVRKIFGWEDSSTGKEYFEFLSCFIPALAEFVRQKGITQNCFIHISDEPKEEDLPTYRAVYDHIKQYLGGIRVMDAMLCNGQFDEGSGDIPVVLTARAAVNGSGLDKQWVYYCCGSEKYHTNRYFIMPSQRTRILGIMLYLYNTDGFLQWGHNFYRSDLSVREIDPYAETDAGGAFPGGDAFIVYPGKDAPIDSLRHEVFYDGIQDYLALKTLESATSREFVMGLLKEEEVKNFGEYPMSAAWHLQFIKKIKELILKH